VLLEQLLEPPDEALAHGAPLPAQRLEPGRRAVRERAVGIEGRGEHARDLIERRIGGARRVERRGALAAALQVLAQRARGGEEAEHGAELLVREDRADAGAVERGADLGDVARRQRLALGVERHRLANLGERGERLGAGPREREIPRGPPPRGGGAALGERLEDAVPLQIGAGLGRAGIGEEGRCGIGHQASEGSRATPPAPLGIGFCSRSR
jgi:hypothetical protein